MRKIALIMMCLVFIAASATVCDIVFAGPMENAEEFQNKIVEQEEERTSGMVPDSGDSITWQNTDSSGGADSTDQSGQQGQQQGQ